MNYDQEKTYYRGHCLEHDVSDMFQMMVDIALEPRSVMSANVAKAKNRASHDLSTHLGKFDPFASSIELLLKTAYGNQGLGNTLLGTEANIQNIDARVLQKFMMDNVTPKKCLIVGNNVNNHQEFVNLAKERLGDLTAIPEHLYQREKSQYFGGETRVWAETPDVQITVAYESTGWDDPATHDFFVMNSIIGNAQGFSVGGPGKGMYCRSIMNLMARYGFVNLATSVNSHFTDSGLFGMQLTGPGSHGQDLMYVLLQELNRLRNPIPDEELLRAKNILKMNILMNLERDDNRLEEVAKNYQVFGRLTMNEYLDKIDEVTSESINKAAFKLLEGMPSIVVLGSSINTVPTITDVQKMLG